MNSQAGLSGDVRNSDLGRRRHPQPTTRGDRRRLSNTSNIAACPSSVSATDASASAHRLASEAGRMHGLDGREKIVSFA